MSEIRTVFDKNSKQLLNLVKGLKSNDGFQNKLLQNLLQKRDMKAAPVTSAAREKFKLHPQHLSSESDLSDEPARNGYCKDVLCYCPNKYRDSSESHSEESDLNYNFLQKPLVPTKKISFSKNLCCYSKTQVAFLSHTMETVEKDSAGSIAPQRDQPSSSKAVAKLISRDDNSGERNALNVNPKENIAKKPISTVDHCVKMYQKLRIMLPKVSNCIDEISVLLNEEVPPPDGQEDWERRRTRATEFLTRFSRNYLYQLGREITELQKITRILDKPSTHTTTNIHHHLPNAYHTVLQALQAYRNYLPASVSNAMVDKLKTVLEDVCILCEIHSKCLIADQAGCSKSEALIETLSKRSKDLTTKISETPAKVVQADPFDISAAKFSVVDFNVAKAPKSKKSKKNLLDARYSMYSLSSSMRKEAFWKKTIQALARDKLKYNHVQSRYRTAGYKHRPPIDQPVELPVKSKLFQKRSACTLKATPLVSVRNDDDIPTMVGMQSEKESKTNNFSKPTAKDAEIIFRGMQELYQKCYSKSDMEMTQEQWTNLVKSLLGMDLHGKINKGSEETGSKKNGFNHQADTFGDFAQVLMQNIQQMSSQSVEDEPAKTKEQHGRNGVVTKHQSEVPLENSEKGPQNGELEAIVSTKKSNVCTTDERPKRNVSYDVEIYKPGSASNERGGRVCSLNNRGRQTITVTGAKNAQLICIRDEDSVRELPEEPLPPFASNKTGVNRGSGAPSQSQGPNLNGGVSKSSIKISRLPKRSLKQLVLMPQEQVTKVVKYKFQYSKFTNGNHLYQKTSRIKPWILVDEISERLLDDLLLSLADEIQITSVVDGMIRSEFQ